MINKLHMEDSRAPVSHGHGMLEILDHSPRFLEKKEMYFCFVWAITVFFKFPAEASACLIHRTLLRFEEDMLNIYVEYSIMPGIWGCRCLIYDYDYYKVKYLLKMVTMSVNWKLKVRFFKLINLKITVKML